jgi:metal-dependent hydrolase (beta-lactamase superfamily II)
MSPVHAVIGEFHLAPHKEVYVRETVVALKELGTMSCHFTAPVSPFMKYPERDGRQAVALLYGHSLRVQWVTGKPC